MDLAMALVRGLYALNALVILSCGCLFCLKRFLWRRRKRLGKHNLGFYPTYTSAGNALQALQAITQPRAQHVLEEKFEDEADDDDEGEPIDPEMCIRDSGAPVDSLLFPQRFGTEPLLDGQED